MTEEQKKHREEQIEEIKDCIDSVYGCDCAYYGVEGMAIAQALYNAGYRKQSDGVWVSKEHISKSKRGRTIHYATYKCSVCGKWNGKHKQNYCPNCGAKMKGGAE